MSDSKKSSPPWMVPDEGDEHGQKLADDAVAQDGAATDDDVAEEAQDTGEQEATVPDSSEGSERDLAAKVEELQQEIRESKDRLLRVAADFENFRKRSRREQQDALVRGREEILKELMVVFDNLERAIDAAGAHDVDATATAIIEGVVMVQKQFADGLGRFGLKQFSALHQPFDPNFHEAVASVESNEHEPGTVVQEYQKGYMLGERLLRPSMVVVASANSRVEALTEATAVTEEESSETIQVSVEELATGAEEPEEEPETETEPDPEPEPEVEEETQANDDDGMDESEPKEGSA